MIRTLDDVSPNTVSGAAPFLIESAHSTPEAAAEIATLVRKVRTSNSAERSERISKLVDLIVGDLEP